MSVRMTHPHTAAPERTPTVLVVLVARDAAAWLRETVAALAAQSYPRMAVLGVDDGSTTSRDRSWNRRSASGG
jgi:hypothetical protein